MTAYGFRPSRKFFLKRMLQLTLTCIVATGFTFLLGSWIGGWVGGPKGSHVGQIASLILNLMWFIPGLLLCYPMVRKLFYEIHEDEVVLHTGLIMRKVTHVPIQRIIMLRVLRDPIDRLFGLGTVQIQTAASSNHQGSECLMGLDKYKDIYDRLVSLSRS